MHNKRKILLLGGTGAMGVYLAPELLNSGYQVYVTSRSEHISNERDLIYIKGDAKDINFLHKLLDQKFDAIVDFMVYNTEEFRERYIKLLSSTSHYLFLSSYRVYGDNHGKPITEESPRLLDSVDDQEYLATDEYGLTKARQENILRESGYKNWTILRPAITYSKERFQLGTMEAHEFLQRALKGKSIIFPKQMLSKQATMSWAGDVARLISRMVMKSEAMCEAFTVSTSEHHTWREIVDYYTDILNVHIKIVDLSVYQDIIGRPYQIKYDRMFDRIIDNSKALAVAEMNQEDFMPLKDGLRIELANFAKNPVYRGYNATREQKMDKVVDSSISQYIYSFKRKLQAVKKLHRQKKLLPKVREKLFKLPILRKIKKAFLLLRNGSLLPKIRAKVFQLPGFRTIKKTYLKLRTRKYDGAIVTLTGAYNYGSVVQRWALQNFLSANGLRFRILDMPFMQKMGRNVGDRTAVQEFIETKLDSDGFDPLRSSYYKSYIVGSDQVWRDFFNDWNKFGIFFLTFLGEKNAKRVAYAASFGFDKWSGPYLKPQQKDRISKYVKKFDAISVREKSGIGLVNELGNKAVHVLDPTLLMNASDYSKIIEHSKYASVETAPLFYYILDKTDAKITMIQAAGELLGLETGGIIPTDNTPLVSTETWLKGFRDAEFIFTDSFHGMVFSIINRKSFFVFANKTRGVARMTELLDLLGIENRIIFPDDENQNLGSMLRNPIDWNAVEKRLSALKKESGNWLLNALK